MSNTSIEALEGLSLACNLASQLHLTMSRFLQTCPQAHESWFDLTDDIGCIERRLRALIDVMLQVPQQDPTLYTEVAHTQEERALKLV